MADSQTQSVSVTVNGETSPLRLQKSDKLSERCRAETCQAVAKKVAVDQIESYRDKHVCTVCVLFSLATSRAATCSSRAWS